MINNIIILIMCHMIGDYVLQTDFIAQTKGKNWYHLLVHCILYCIPFAIIFGIDFKLLFIFLTHLTIDPLKARYNKITYIQDQIYHYITLLLYYCML